MDPITAIMGVASLAGMGASIFGGISASQTASQIAGDQSQIDQLDVQVNAQKNQEMMLTANRQQLQNIRNSQQQRSLAVSRSVNQGAQFGTGLPGGEAQVSGQANTNALGISQNLQIGQNIFGLDNQADMLKMQIAQLGGTMSTDQGIANIGADIFKSAPALGRIGTTLFGGTSSGGSIAGGMGLTGGSNMYAATGMLY